MCSMHERDFGEVLVSPSNFELCPVTKSGFSSGFNSIKVSYSFSLEKLNRSISGLKNLLVICSFSSLVLNQPLRVNSKGYKGIQIGSL